MRSAWCWSCACNDDDATVSASSYARTNTENYADFDAYSDADVDGNTNVDGNTDADVPGPAPALPYSGLPASRSSWHRQ